MNEQNASILIVDDDRPTLDFLSTCLGDKYNCTVAGSVEQAIKLLTRSSFDLLLTDVLLSDASGLGLCRLVKKKYGDTAVIAMSAAPETTYKTLAMMHGAFDYLHKPFTLARLFISTEGALNRKALVSRARS